MAVVGVSTSMGSNYVTNLLLQGSLNSLWSMLENQQMVVHLSLNNIAFPGNVAYFYSYL